jgi:hypothetical protein
MKNQNVTKRTENRQKIPLFALLSPVQKIHLPVLHARAGWLAISAAVAVLAAPGVARACACGCGVFDVATADMFPQGYKGMLYLMYDFQDQNHNWSETGPAAASENGDKRLETQFTTIGLQYMFSTNWGMQAELPYDFRSFSTVSAAPGNPVTKQNWGSLGDARLQAIYTGFSSDQSSGISFGLKLPTGDYSHNNSYGDIDRDSELGTGSTDILLGYFHHHHFAGDWNWYAQALLDVPVLIQDQYRPGAELDAATGLYGSGWMINRLMITPFEQIIASERTSDTGAYASGGALDGGPAGSDSGYQRVMLSQGIEFHMHPYPISFYADVEVPVFQCFRGNQVTASQLFKAVLSYHF